MPEGSCIGPQRCDRTTTLLERGCELSFAAYDVFALLYRVPVLEHATFPVARMAAGTCAVRQRQRSRLATAVPSGIFAIGAIAHGL